MRPKVFPAHWTLVVALLVVPARLAAGDTDAAEKEPIKVGATLALSGKLAFIGQSQRRGMEMAAAEINRAGGLGGHPLELVFEDNAGEPKNAVSGVLKMLAVDKVDVLVSAFTHITQAVRPIAEQRKRLLFYSSTLSDIARGSKLIFKDHYDSHSAGEAIGRLVVASGAKRAAYVSEINDACEAYEAGFLEVIKGKDPEVVSRELYIPGEIDLRTVLLRVRASLPDVIVLCTWRDTRIIMKQLNELGMLNIRTFHLLAPFLPVNDTPEVRALLEKNGAQSTWYGFAERAGSEKHEEFISKYTKQYGEAPKPDAGYFYDDVRVLAKALEACLPHRPLSQQCLARELLSSEYDGVGGRVVFDGDGVSNRPVLAIKLQDGVWQEISAVSMLKGQNNS